MDYAATAEWLCSLKNQGTRFGVERMALLAAALGHPEEKFPSLLLAGSNGKGSTAAMLEAIFRAHGHKTGLYTSPHLLRLGERVQVNRMPLPEEKICAYTARLAPVARRLAAADSELHPSFFEFMTAMAFEEFAAEKIDVGILEVGLGGRLDATNIVMPRVSVITSISLEHTEYLGDTLEEIAAEKGGIIKPEVPVALGVLPEAAEKVLRKIAAERGAPVFSVRERFGAEENFPTANLRGAHQRANAALAWLSAELAAEENFLCEETVRRALQSVAWAGRWQEFPLPGERRLILDVAHNAEGAAVLEPLLENLQKEAGRKPLVVTGVLGRERAEPLFRVLARHAASLHLVRPEQERACSIATLRECIPADFPGAVVAEEIARIFPAPGECTLGGTGDVIVVAGSVYLAGEVLGSFLAGAKAESFLQDRLPPSAKEIPHG